METGGAYVVELPYQEQEDLQQMIEAMQRHGFLEQKYAGVGNPAQTWTPG